MRRPEETRSVPSIYRAQIEIPTREAEWVRSNRVSDADSAPTYRIVLSAFAFSWESISGTESEGGVEPSGIDVTRDPSDVACGTISAEVGIVLVGRGVYERS
jgi:hypothetical protein